MTEIEVQNGNDQDNGFDGELICGIDKEIKSRGHDFLGLLKEREKDKNYKPLKEWRFLGSPMLFLDRAETVPVLLLAAGDSIASIAPYRSYMRSPKRYDRAELTLMRSEYQRKIFDIICDGRIRVSVLLNSSGGLVDTGNTYIRLFKHLRGHKGIVDAYVSMQAGSMAADIFNNADNRFVLRDSSVMWHAEADCDGSGQAIKGSTNEEKRKELDRRNQHKELLENFFVRSVIAEKRDEVLAVLNRACADPQNPRGELHLSGQQLFDYGIATRMFDDLRDMEQFFAKRTHLDPCCMLDRDCYLDRFFSMSALEEHAGRICGLPVRIIDGKWCTFPTVKLTDEDLAKVLTRLSQIPNFEQPDLAGHNLRVAGKDRKDGLSKP